MSRRAFIRDAGLREYLSIETGWLREWLSLPLLCKRGKHTVVTREHYNEDAGAVEEVWRECERCQTYLGHDFTAGTGWLNCYRCGAVGFGNFDCIVCREHLPGGDPI